MDWDFRSLVKLGVIFLSIGLVLTYLLSTMIHIDQFIGDEFGIASLILASVSLGIYVVWNAIFDKFF